MEKQVDRPRTRGGFNTADGMFSVAGDQRIITWNSAAEKLLGYTEQQVVGKKCYDVLCAGNSHGRVRCRRECVVVTNAGKGRVTRDFDLECKTYDGAPVLLNMSVLLLRSGPSPREVLHLFRDVTDRRSVERASSPGRSAVNGELAVTNGNSTVVQYKLPPLTTREDQALRLLAAGKNTTDISEILAIRPLTARNHVSRLLAKLGCRSRLEAVALGTRSGLL
ncbi:MAG: PAS and helix-turn-helix domain-containing protein [Chloroflexi bacterium]|nr:PAS and helix-turn-helix domain-containing protein [Chloroflexota bacterium]